MEINNKLDALLGNQKDILKQYEDLVKEISIDESINENILLKKELEEYRKNLDELDKRQSKLLEDNISLNIALKEQIINEKLAILNASKQKVELYFKDETRKNTNQLGLLEKSAKDKLNKLRVIAKSGLIEGKEEIFAHISEIESELEGKIAAQKEELEKDKENVLDGIRREYDELRNDGVSEEVIQKKKKYNDIEAKIGLNWINKIGVVLLLLGVATVMKHTYSTWLNDFMKGIAGFVLGGVLLVAGEWLNRKQKNLFALGLIGGGIGTLYLSVFSSYFILDILSLTTSMIISVLITMVSLILSLRYKSKTICSLSLIGGYLPFFSYVFSFGLSGESIYIAMGYLLIMNILVLGISFKMRWIHINYLSFLLNIPCMVYLIFISPSEIISIGYVVLTFLMYLAITLVYPIMQKINLRVVDVVLLGLNTVINCSLVYGLFEQAEFGDFRGLIALVYALIYLGLGQLVHKSASQERGAQALFYLTAITFSVLMIPFQFGIEWASLGWLIESILLISFAVRRNQAKMEIAGWGILILTVWNFMLADVAFFWPMDHFTLKYSLITLGLVYVLSLYAKELAKSELFKHTRKGMLLTAYKYFAIVSTWIYLLRMAITYYEKYIPSYPYDNFYLLILLALITVFYAYALPRIKFLQDKVVNGISIAQYILADLLCFAMNFFEVGNSMDQTYRFISIAVLVLYNIFVLISVKDLTVRLIKKRGLNLEIYPIAMAIYFLGTTTIILVNQFNLGNINLVISIFLLVMALAYIAIGFKKRFVILRRAGLALSILSTGKLFLFDLAFLETGGKIIAYFCFGLILIGISFVYDRARRSMERIEG